MAAGLRFRIRVAGVSRIDSAGVLDESYKVFGIARLEGNELVLEWSGTISVDEVGQVIESRVEQLPVTEVRIPLAELESAEFRRRWWWKPVIVLRGANLGAFSDVPGSKNGNLVLRLARKDRDQGRDLAASLELALSEHALVSAEQFQQLRDDSGDLTK